MNNLIKLLDRFGAALLGGGVEARAPSAQLPALARGTLMQPLWILPSQLVNYHLPFS